MNTDDTSTVMKQMYLFIFSDDSLYQTSACTCFKHAIREVLTFLGDYTKLLDKCLTSFEADDIESIIELVDHFTYKTISKIYIIQEKLYDDT